MTLIEKNQISADRYDFISLDEWWLLKGWTESYPSSYVIAVKGFTNHFTVVVTTMVQTSQGRWLYLVYTSLLVVAIYSLFRWLSDI